MADSLTAEERALIANFPKRRVQKIPNGKSYHDGYIYDENKQGLVLRNPDQDSKAPASYLNRIRAQRKARIEEFKVMASQGKTAAQMAQLLNVSVTTIHSYARDMGVQVGVAQLPAPKREPQPQKAKLSTIKATDPRHLKRIRRREQVRRYVELGYCFKKIVELTKTSAMTIRRDLDDLGLKPADGRKKRRVVANG